MCDIGSLRNLFSGQTSYKPSNYCPFLGSFGCSFCPWSILFFVVSSIGTRLSAVLGIMIFFEKDITQPIFAWRNSRFSHLHLFELCCIIQTVSWAWFLTLICLKGRESFCLKSSKDISVRFQSKNYFIIAVIVCMNTDCSWLLTWMLLFLSSRKLIAFRLWFLNTTASYPFLRPCAASKCIWQFHST